MTQINPYRKNCEVVQGFFAKPLTLIMAIALCLSFILNFAYSVSFVSVLSFPLLSILAIIGFFTLFFASKTLNGKSLSTPIKLLMTYSIAEIIVSSILFISAIVATIVLLFSSSTVAINNSFLIYMFGIVIPSVTIDLLLYIFMLRMLRSFKNSTSSVFLYKNGTVSLGVTAIIAIVNTIFSTLINLLVVNNQDNLTPIAKAFTANAPLFLTITILTALINCIVYLLMAIYGFSYNSFIKDVCNRIVINKPVERYYKPVQKTPEQVQPVNIPVNTYNNVNTNVSNNFDSSTIGMWESIYGQQQPVTPPVVQQPMPAPLQPPTQPPIAEPQPVQFNPQPVQFNPEPVFVPQQNNDMSPQPVNNPYKPVPPYQNTPIHNPYINQDYH